VDGKVDGAQVHVLSYLGTTWGRGAPRFTEAQLTAFCRTVTRAGGVVTWDVPIEKGGRIAPAFLEQLTVVGKTLGRPASTPANIIGPGKKAPGAR
jgi:hypothetical protein